MSPATCLPWTNLPEPTDLDSKSVPELLVDEGVPEIEFEVLVANVDELDVVSSNEEPKSSSMS